jgi:hypothetical protein
LKLVNAGTRDLTVRLSTLRAWPEGLRAPQGHARAPNPRWLKTGPPVKVKAGSVVPAALELLVPDEPRYRGRRWSFLVAADAEGGGRPGRALFVLNVETETGEGPERPRASPPWPSWPGGWRRPPRPPPIPRRSTST